MDKGIYLRSGNQDLLTDDLDIFSAIRVMTAGTRAIFTKDEDNQSRIFFERALGYDPGVPLRYETGASSGIEVTDELIELVKDLT